MGRYDDDFSDLNWGDNLDANWGFGNNTFTNLWPGAVVAFPRKQHALAYWATDAPTSNHTAYAKVSIWHATSHYAGILARLTDVNNWYGLRLVQLDIPGPLDVSMVLEKSVAGVVTQLDAASMGLLGGTLAMQVAGATIRAGWANAADRASGRITQVLVSATDTDLPDGLRSGIYGYTDQAGMLATFWDWTQFWFEAELPVFQTAKPNGDVIPTVHYTFAASIPILDNNGILEFPDTVPVEDLGDAVLYVNLPIISGICAISGVCGVSGQSGTSGIISGVCGTSGLSGVSGTSAGAISGTSGVSGFSGSAGHPSGVSGISGFSATSAAIISGTSGESGISGISGTTAGYLSGTSGHSGASAVSGTSGLSGASGLSAIPSGVSGVSGFSRISGASAIVSGISGRSGVSGMSATSGASGKSGSIASGSPPSPSPPASPSQGSYISGQSGLSGQSGFTPPRSGPIWSGHSGFSGWSACPASACPPSACPPSACPPSASPPSACPPSACPPSACPPSLICAFSDDFDRSNEDPISSNGWVTRDDKGTGGIDIWRIESNKAQYTGADPAPSNATLALVNLGAGCIDIYAQAEFSLDYFAAGIMVRSDGTADNWYACDQGHWRIIKDTAGGISVLQDNGGSSGGTHTLKFTANGTTLTGYNDEVQRVQTTDSDHSGTYVGLRGGQTEGNKNNACSADDYEADLL